MTVPKRSLAVDDAAVVDQIKSFAPATVAVAAPVQLAAAAAPIARPKLRSIVKVVLPMIAQLLHLPNGKLLPVELLLWWLLLHLWLLLLL